MKKTWVLSLANLACLIHCIGFGLISVFFPVILLKLHWEWLEYGVLMLNLVLGTLTLKSLPGYKFKLLGLYGLIALGLGLLLSHHHSFFHYIILSLSIYQLTLLVKEHFRKKHHCCDHKH